MSYHQVDTDKHNEAVPCTSIMTVAQDQEMFQSPVSASLFGSKWLSSSVKGIGQLATNPTSGIYEEVIC